MNSEVTLLVNSSDSFADCWPPFFELLATHWPDCPYRVLLNTEEANWSDDRFSMTASRVAAGSRVKLTWSECLIRAINQIETPLLLYFQEDYFVDRPIRTELVAEAVALMLANPELGHVALTRHGSFGPHLPSPYPGFLSVGPKARYRISTQAGLWRPAVLLSYLDSRENGWMFEIFGTRRAHRRRDQFLVADFTKDGGGPAIDYIHTGIIKGRWHKAIPPLFAKHGLKVDFDQRGFFHPPPKVLAKWDVAKRLLQDPLHALRQLI